MRTVRNRADYEYAEPKQFGDLHERMKFLVKLISVDNYDSTPLDVRTAIYDLEIEVKHYNAQPSFGRRIVSL